MTGGVSLIKSHPFTGLLIHVRRFMKATPITTEITPSQIIDQKKNDIGGSRFQRKDRHPEKHAQGGKTLFHGKE